MAEVKKQYRFLFIPAFRLPSKGRFTAKSAVDRADVPKEKGLWGYHLVKDLLEDVEWDLHEGALATWGDWPVANREERCLAAAGRLPIVRAACESGKYNAIILLGGIDPGFLESREIARKYRIPVTACSFSQMHIASMLGDKFSMIEMAENSVVGQNLLVAQYRFTERCASIRNINVPHVRPGHEDRVSLGEEEQKALRGEPSEAVERAVKESVAAIEEDGAEVITLGCSRLFWVQPYLQKRMNEIGWDIPVLEGYSSAILLAKLLVGLGVDASGLAFPGDQWKKWRRKKIY